MWTLWTLKVPSGWALFYCLNIFYLFPYLLPLYLPTYLSVFKWFLTPLLKPYVATKFTFYKIVDFFIKIAYNNSKLKAKYYFLFPIGLYCYLWEFFLFMWLISK